MPNSQLHRNCTGDIHILIMGKSSWRFFSKVFFFERVLKSIYLNQICSIIFYNILSFLGQSHNSIAIELLWFLIEKLLQVIFTDLF